MRRRWAGLDRVAFTGGGQVFGMGKVSIASRGTWPSAAVFWSVEGCADETRREKDCWRRRAVRAWLDAGATAPSLLASLRAGRSKVQPKGSARKGIPVRPVHDRVRDSRRNIHHDQYQQKQKQKQKLILCLALYAPLVEKANLLNVAQSVSSLAPFIRQCR
ncbi:hypothetical protein KCU73_g52, partial [Aureobasidium melanogenum]